MKHTRTHNRWKWNYKKKLNANLHWLYRLMWAFSIRMNWAKGKPCYAPIVSGLTHRETERAKKKGDRVLRMKYQLSLFLSVFFFSYDLFESEKQANQHMNVIKRMKTPNVQIEMKLNTVMAMCLDLTTFSHKRTHIPFAWTLTTDEWRTRTKMAK